MIYTVGDTQIYINSMIKNGSIKKMGRSDSYVGGSVWKTYIEALRHAPQGYSVFGVDANWEKDTIPSSEPNATWHDLLITSPIILL